MLFMSFSTVPEVQPWTCHQEDHHFTHLTETQREKKGRKKRLGEEREGKEMGEQREGDNGGKEGTWWENMAEDETDVLHGRNHNLCMKTSTLIKQESMVLLHTDEWKRLRTFISLISVVFFLPSFCVNFDPCSVDVAHIYIRTTLNQCVYHTVCTVRSGACCWTLVSYCLEARI